MSPSNIISAIYQLKFLLIVERTAYTYAYYSSRWRYILRFVALLMCYCSLISNSVNCFALDATRLHPNHGATLWQAGQHQGQRGH